MSANLLPKANHCALVALQSLVFVIFTLGSNIDSKTDSNVQIAFSQEDSIRIWSSKDNKQRVIADGFQVVGVSVDVQNHYVYWTDVAEGREAIYRSKLNGEGINNRVAIIDTGLSIPEGIAFDWITGNIYFTDANRSHIVACNGEGTFCSVIIQGYSDKPREICLQPSQGLMFWTDWGLKPAIVRAGMDGSEALQIVTTGLIWPNGLAVDHGQSRLYWMDAQLDVIESSTLNGEDRQTIKSQGINHPFSLDVFGDMLYWSDWTSQSIQSCNKSTGESHEILISVKGAKNIHGLAIFHPDSQPKTITNPCSLAQCSHICVLTPQNSSACICPAGLILDRAEGKCVDDKSKAKLIIAQDNRLRIFRPDTIGRDVLEESKLTGPRNISAIIYNPINNTLIIADAIKKKIYEYTQGSNNIRIIANGHIDSIQGLALDLVGQNLYWVDYIRRKVEVMSMRNGVRAILTSESYYPKDIVVIPEKKYIFLALTYRKGGRILRMSMDGKSRKNVYKIRYGEPVALTYNIELNRIFWCDTIKNSIEHVSLDGLSQSTSVRADGNPYSITNIGNRVYWTDRHTQLLTSLPVYGGFQKEQPLFIGHSEDSQNTTLISYMLGNFYAKLTVIDQDIARYSTLMREHECAKKSPKCSHICLMSEGDNVGTCICPEGMVIGSDGQTCSSNTRTCTEFQFECNDKKCIHLDERCDKFPDCSSAEDELNCPPPPPVICRKSDFICVSGGSCIPSRWRCDGKEDCRDGSDEDDCSFDYSEVPSEPPREETREIEPFDEQTEESSSRSHNEESSSSGGASTAIIVIVILTLLGLALIMGFILQKRRIHPKSFVQPYVQQLVRYVNRPVKRWRQQEHEREKLTDEHNTYENAYENIYENINESVYTYDDTCDQVPGNTK